MYRGEKLSLLGEVFEKGRVDGWRKVFLSFSSNPLFSLAIILPLPLFLPASRQVLKGR